MLYNLNDLFCQYVSETRTFTTILSNYAEYIKGFDHIAFRALSNNETLKESSNLILQPTKFAFDKYNAKAEWYKTDNKFKRIFMSHYNGFSTDNNLTFEEKQLVANIMNNKKPLTYNDYIIIHNKNQYLAWTLVHQNKINHVALEVYNIKELTEQLINDGFKMNKVNDQIYNIGLNGKLVQTSIVADKITHKFADGEYQIPASFVEFVQRIDDIDGFDNDNANNIVLSTRLTSVNLPNCK